MSRGDIADRASELEEVQRDEALAQARSKNLTGPSRLRCVDCDSEIPAARRKAVCALRCADCQQDFEYLQKRKRHHAA